MTLRYQSIVSVLVGTLKTDGLIENSSVREAGYIHTAQRLEFDYVGEIIGDNLRMEDGKLVTDFTKRAKTDQSLRSIKKLAKEDPEKAYEVADSIIRNTYRTLMT